MRNEKMLALRGKRTQKKVASEIGIPQSTYAMIENGYRFPRKDLQLKLAHFFGLTVDELFFSQFDHVMRSEKTGTDGK